MDDPLAPVVMAGLVPTIHVFSWRERSNTNPALTLTHPCHGWRRPMGANIGALASPIPSWAPRGGANTASLT
jgi:hypothetical protein